MNAEADLESALGWLNESAALLGGSDRTLLAVEGARALQVLNGLATNDLRRLDDEVAVYAFVLTPKGRPVAEIRAIRLDQAVLLDLPDACAAALQAHLARYVPPRLATVRPAGELARISVVGPAAGAALLRATGGKIDLPLEVPLAVARIRESAQPAAIRIIVRREPIEGPGFDLYVADSALARCRESLREAVEEVGGGTVGPEAYRVWRVERGIPTYGAEITPDVLPQETGQEGRAISFEKGCYTGQEVVARIHYRGHVNRLLRGLRFAEDEPPAASGPLFQGAREVGRVTTAVRSPRFGPIGLGYVRREIAPHARVALHPEGPASVEVVDLPFTTA